MIHTKLSADVDNSGKCDGKTGKGQNVDGATGHLLLCISAQFESLKVSVNFL